MRTVTEMNTDERRFGKEHSRELASISGSDELLLTYRPSLLLSLQQTRQAYTLRGMLKFGGFLFSSTRGLQ
jgi:hypothetical protein